MRDGQPDYYTILQVNPRAEPEVIQAAYRRLSAKYHPDINPSPEAPERMRLLNDAYEVLSDPAKRREHDLSRYGERQQTIRDTSTKQFSWLFLVLALAMLLLLLRLPSRILLVEALVFLILWFLINRRRQRK
ncbi:MAG: DnaJ domain-containing protein [Dehalococcoidales bacterium]|jgi:hypothetical protein|nr:DnaJ domain-containing protein [Dehalococcoidales bacterium]MDP6737475.1 DnaJ domain-containing protein [Dehalococcoidales bacterium]|tara:strand:- start:307 stop:702 length:396 start_codon:yes stop_codon:yes gene_type:complete